MYRLIFIGLIALFSFSAVAEEGASFQQIEMKTLDDEKFVFPDDLDAGQLNIVMLAISYEQDNGTLQGDLLVEWYAALENEGLLNDDVKAWHFSVLKVPFFVKGLIRGGMAESYEGKLPMNQAGPLYTKKPDKFAEEAGIVIDDDPTIVLMTPDGKLHEMFKGGPSEEGLATLKAAIGTYVPAAAD